PFDGSPSGIFLLLQFKKVRPSIGKRDVLGWDTAPNKDSWTALPSLSCGLSTWKQKMAASVLHMPLFALVEGPRESILAKSPPIFRRACGLAEIGILALPKCLTAI